MKKIVSLTLCVLMLAGILAGCGSKLSETDKGSVINMYLTNEIFSFDPATSYTDASCAKILSLIYEGITVLNDNGKYEYGMMDRYEINKEENSMLIYLRDSKWSDGTDVQARDFVFAWTRILEPDFKCDAACLLYDVKNARAAKMGDASIDDVGITAPDVSLIKIEFEGAIDYEQFLQTLASPALVPVRESAVQRGDDWGTKASTILTNGPFDVKKIDYKDELRLERSTYYLRNTDKNQALDKYVKPYRIVVHYNYGNNDEQLNYLMSDDDATRNMYIGEIPLSAREQYKKDAEVSDTMVTHAYYFNTTNNLFQKAEVRRALSLALDREQIVSLITYATPATGLIPTNVFDATNKTYFREVSDKQGALVGTTASVEEAKSLLSSAGVKSGSFTLTVRDDEVDLAIANYAIGVWEELGFKVKLKTLTGERDKSNSTDTDEVYTDEFLNAYKASDFDVIAVDIQMLAPDAYSALAPFSPQFSGNGVDMASDNYDVIGHVTGYDSDEYNELIEQAYAEKTRAARCTILHTAEQKLLEDMPVIPVVFLQDAYIYTNDLSGIGSTYFGRDFKKLKLKNYADIKAAIEAKEEEAAA